MDYVKSTLISKFDVFSLRQYLPYTDKELFKKIDLLYSDQTVCDELADMIFSLYKKELIFNFKTILSHKFITCIKYNSQKISKINHMICKRIANQYNIEFLEDFFKNSPLEFVDVRDQYCNNDNDICIDINLQYTNEDVIIFDLFSSSGKVFHKISKMVNENCCLLSYGIRKDATELNYTKYLSSIEMLKSSTKEYTSNDEGFVFNICNLFDEKNVQVSLDSKMKIIIGENGFGKSSIYKLVVLFIEYYNLKDSLSYSSLNRNFRENPDILKFKKYISEIPFDYIEIYEKKLKGIHYKEPIFCDQVSFYGIDAAYNKEYEDKSRRINIDKMLSGETIYHEKLQQNAIIVSVNSGDKYDENLTVNVKFYDCNNTPTGPMRTFKLNSFRLAQKYVMTKECRVGIVDSIGNILHYEFIASGASLNTINYFKELNSEELSNLMIYNEKIDLNMNVSEDIIVSTSKISGLFLKEYEEKYLSPKEYLRLCGISLNTDIDYSFIIPYLNDKISFEIIFDEYQFVKEIISFDEYVIELKLYIKKFILENSRRDDLTLLTKIDYEEVIPSKEEMLKLLNKDKTKKIFEVINSIEYKSLLKKILSRNITIQFELIEYCNKYNIETKDNEILDEILRLMKVFNSNKKTESFFSKTSNILYCNIAKTKIISDFSYESAQLGKYIEESHHLREEIEREAYDDYLEQNNEQYNEYLFNRDEQDYHEQYNCEHDEYFEDEYNLDDMESDFYEDQTDYDNDYNDFIRHNYDDSMTFEEWRDKSDPFSNENIEYNYQNYSEDFDYEREYNFFSYEDLKGVTIGKFELQFTNHYTANEIELHASFNIAKHLSNGFEYNLRDILNIYSERLKFIDISLFIQFLNLIYSDETIIINDIDINDVSYRKKVNSTYVNIIEKNNSLIKFGLFYFLENVNEKFSNDIKEIVDNMDIYDLSIKNTYKKCLIISLLTFYKKVLTVTKLSTLTKLINKYLINKEIVIYTHYLMVVSDHGNYIPINKLSTGETNLIYIMFTSILLENVHLILDEPDASLSVEWQSNILCDLSKFSSNNIVAISQSPFLIKGNGLQNFVEIIKEDIYE